MKKTAYRISEKAKKDLEGIWIYTYENWSDIQADRYYNLIINEIEFLSENFETGKSINQVKEGYRTSKIKSHLICYKKGDDGMLEVIRILHQRMDVENRLND